MPPPWAAACSRRSARLACAPSTNLPVAGWRIPAALFAAMGLLGMAYSWRVWQRMVAGGIMASIDWEDRAWYVAVPALAYLLLAVAGAALAADPATAVAVLAVTISLLLLAGIRNAWDMTTWVVLRRKE